MSIFQHRGSELLKRSPVSCFLILVNTVFYIITLIKGGPSVINLYKLGALHLYAIEAGEYHRLLTTMFLHGSIMHYLFNTFFGVLIIGAALEKLIGSVKFFLIYIVSGIASSFSVLLMSNAFLTVGASGAIYGTLGLFLFIIVYRKEMLTINDRIYVRNLILINLIFTVIAPSVSISGHIGGLIFGFFQGFLLLNKEKTTFS